MVAQQPVIVESGERLSAKPINYLHRLWSAIDVVTEVDQVPVPDSPPGDVLFNQAVQCGQQIKPSVNVADRVDSAIISGLRRVAIDQGLSVVVNWLISRTPDPALNVRQRADRLFLPVL